MKKLNHFLLIAFIASYGSYSIAQIYKWKDTKGTTHYSNAVVPDIKGAQKQDIQTEYTPAAPTYYPSYNQPTNNQTVYRRTVIPQENNDDDFAHCAAVKREAVIAERRHSPNANRLDEWLWKNCRSYADDLRKIEQDMM